MTVSVTKGDIIHGKRLNPADCAVARAARRAAGGDAFVSVTVDAVRIDGRAYPTPAVVAEAIHAIDAGWGKFVRPFEFTLDVPQEKAA
jgi:hypothetical protein